MKRWKLTQQNYDEKVEYSLIDTKINMTVQMSLTNWMLIDVFTTVGGFDKVVLDESVDEKKLLEYLEFEKQRN
jgi:hypothetical protein